MRSEPVAALLNRAGRWLWALLLVALCSIGCRHGGAPPAEARARNVFQLTPSLPNVIRRVAVLPISTASVQQDAEAGSAQLQAIVSSELNRSGRFEVVEIAPEQMALWTGRRSWPPEEALPADFLEKMRAAVDADAVLFTHLAAYQPYKPMLMGWNLKLVDANAGYILWAADEVYDAADPAVAKSAARHRPPVETGWKRLGTDDAVLLSPRRFAQFSLETTFQTVPSR